MTPNELKQARKALGLSQPEMGKLLGGYCTRSVAGWEAGEFAIPPAVRVILEMVNTKEEAP